MYFITSIPVSGHGPAKYEVNQSPGKHEDERFKQ
jgi:hypothetical protein